MKIYQASLTLRVLLAYHELFPERKLNVLKSFGTLNNESYDFCVTHRDKIGSLILDSGTWTLNNAKSDVKDRITLQNYLDYAKTVRPYYDLVFNFDSNFTEEGFEENYANQLTLERAGLDPVPVVHDICGDEIEHYLGKGYRSLALGSFQMKSVKNLEFVMDRLRGANVKIHLFGNTRFDFLANFPIDTCDSAEWAHTGAYGFIRYWDLGKEDFNKEVKIYLEEYLDVSKKRKETLSDFEHRTELLAYLKNELGVPEHDLLGDDGAFFKQLVNVHYYAKLEEIVNRIHRQRGFIK
jgi:hypothetical protein